MTGDHLDAILKLAGAKNEKSEKDGWVILPDGSTMSLHVAHDGASMTVWDPLESTCRHASLSIL